MPLFVCVKGIKFWIFSCDLMSESIGVLLSVCLNFRKTFRGLKLCRMSPEPCVPKQGLCLSGVKGPGRSAGWASAPGVPDKCPVGWNGMEGGGCWVSAPGSSTGCLHRVLLTALPLRGHGRPAIQPWCNAPCPGTVGEQGGREQLAAVSAACRVNCLACSVLPECFWGCYCRLV